MTKRRPNPATRPSPLENDIFFTFAGGFSPVKGQPLPEVPREQWESEIEQMHAEEREWWAGKLVAAELSVELPFWLMMPDGEISLTHEETTAVASIHGRYLEVADGPMSLSSRNNAVVIGPGDDVWTRELPESIVPSRMPVYRPTKTVVSFRVNIMDDCFHAWQKKGEIAPDDRAGIRRVNRVIQYLTAMATAHIPFLNRLITSYRSTSLDPFAFEVSEWDVPVWYASHDVSLIRIGLMPYWDSDTFPAVNLRGETVPFVATTLDEVQAQARTTVAPGKLELLDAYSLMYRGRFGDAVRSAVTDIEVAVESQLSRLLYGRGHSKEQVAERLEKTRNSFFERISDYEQLSQKRLPGPLIHDVPYINGIRLRAELDWVRNLRHKVVHEGIRVDICERGTTLRAVETMSWLFEWLSWEDEHGPKDSRNYTFFNLLRGQSHYVFEYTKDGVRVSRRAQLTSDTPIITADQLFIRQYLGTTDRNGGDLDLLVRMSFEWLRIGCEEGPPEPLEEPKLRERYLINDNGRTAAVFCLEFDDLMDMAAAEAVVDRVGQIHTASGECRILVIVHHQRQIEKRLREMAMPFPQEVQDRLGSCDVIYLTAIDLQLLVLGVLTCGWPIDPIRNALFTPGRQAEHPPGYRLVGKCNRYYPAHSVVSIDLNEGEAIARGARVAIRLGDRYHEDVVTSMQISGVDVPIANGPCRVGIATSLTKTDVKPGQLVFVKRP